MTVYSTTELAGFRLAQRVAYAAVASVETSLGDGATERDAAALVHERLAAAGVRHYFHRPLAWFGDRTSLGDDCLDEVYLPTDRALRPGMPVILDVAPIVDGYVADVAYSFAFGDNFDVTLMLGELAAIRDAIPRALRRGHTLAGAYRRIDAMIARRGYTNRHREDPFGRIGHRVMRLRAAAGDAAFDGVFGPSAVAALRDDTGRARVERHAWPLWRDRAESAGPAPYGVWAIDPHLGRDGIGAKFEELLVVTADGVHWLDDDLPHVKRHAARPLLLACPPPPSPDRRAAPRR